jgi:hypothetical protein
MLVLPRFSTMERLETLFPNFSVSISEVVILSISLAFLNLLAFDFSKTFLKRPQHFPKEKWLSWFFKPKVEVPVVEAQDGEDYRQLLARGSKMAG